MLYINYVHLYPELKILDLYPDKELASWKYDKHLLWPYSIDFNISAFNQNSKAKLKASVQYEHIRNDIPTFYLILGFIIFQVVVAFGIIKLCSCIINPRNKKTSKNIKTSSILSPKHKLYQRRTNQEEIEPLLIENMNSESIESILLSKYKEKYGGSYKENQKISKRNMNYKSKDKVPLLNKSKHKVRFYDEEYSD